MDNLACKGIIYQTIFKGYYICTKLQYATCFINPISSLYYSIPISGADHISDNIPWIFFWRK